MRIKEHLIIFRSACFAVGASFLGLMIAVLTELPNKDTLIMLFLVIPVLIFIVALPKYLKQSKTLLNKEKYLREKIKKHFLIDLNIENRGVFTYRSFDILIQLNMNDLFPVTFHLNRKHVDSLDIRPKFDYIKSELAGTETYLIGKGDGKYLRAQRKEMITKLKLCK